MIEFIQNRTIEGEINIKMVDPEDKSVSFWRADKYILCNHIKSIIAEYMADGYKLTLRQLYYQLVGKDLIPNNISVYKKIGKIVDDLKYSGRIDWSAIEDRGRVPRLSYWITGVKHSLEDTYDQYRRDRQADQDIHIELWTEKDAISNILFRAIDPYHIRLVINKGYTSSSSLYDAYERFVNQINDHGKKIIILYFGDHDPSGIDMVRDIDDRMRTFLQRGDRIDTERVDNWVEFHGGRKTVEDVREILEKREAEYDEWLLRKHCFLHDNFEVKRIGLSMDQIVQMSLPPNPAKMTDPRAKGYINEFGNKSWEVDAIRPVELIRIVQEEVESLIDMDLYQQKIDEENEDKKELKKLISKYK